MTTHQDKLGFRVLIDDDDGVTVLRVEGELDSFSASELRVRITEVLGRPATIVDIREVPFVDSAGLGALVGGIRRLREAGADVVLCCTRSSVLRLLDMTGLDRMVAIAESPAEAGQMLAGAPVPASSTCGL